MNDHFGIGTRAEFVTPPFQVLSQLQVVVDLAVENEDDVSILVADRLPTALNVHYAEATHREADPSIYKTALIIGSSMPNHLLHGRKYSGLDRTAVAFVDPTDPTHRLGS